MRTRLLVSLAALAAALLPATAHAGTISVEAPYASPVELTWIVTAGVSETLYRADGACDTLPIAGAAIIASDFPGGPTPTLDNFSDMPGNGTFCYYVEDDGGLAYSNALEVPVDVTEPVAPPQPTGATPVSAAPAISFAGSTDTTVNGVSSGVDHYDVYRNGVKVNAAAIPDAGPGPYAWSDVGGQSSAPVSGSGTYTYTVLAVDGAGNESLPSTGRAIVLDEGAPAAPATPTGASPVAAAPAIAFNASSDPPDAGVTTGVGHYDVYRGGVKVNSAPITGGGPYAWSDVSGQSSNPVAGSGSYSYTVVAVDGAGNQSAPSGARVIALDANVPNTPATPGGTTPVASAPAITFSATSDPTVGGVSTGVDHYDVYRGGVKVNSSPIPGGGPYAWSDVAGQSAPPVSGSGNYSYTVVAVDAVGNASAPSPARVIALDAAAPNAPLAPGGTSPVASAPAITFSASTDPTVGGVSSGVNHYDVYRDGVKVNASPITGPGPYTWTDTAGQSTPPVSGSGSYSYTVVAVDAVGNASAPSPARVIALDAAAPNAPLAPGGTSPVASAPAITFSASTDPTVGGVSSGVNHYDVYRDGVKVNASPITGAGPYAWSDVAGPSSSPASGSHNYSYTVRAVDAAGNVSVDSPARLILLDSTAPTALSAAPTGLTSVSAAPTITFPGTTDPLVNGVASLVNHYDVYRNGVKMNAAPILDTGALSYTWSDAGAASLSPPTGPASWSYTVRAVDSAGNISTASPPLAIFLDPSAASAPSSIAALATPTMQRPEISWTAVSSVAAGFTVHHYKVYRGGSWVQDVTTGTTFTDTSVGLADGSYTYQVVAAELGDVTLGIASAPVTILFDRAAPTAPGGVAATAALDGSVGISWAAASDAGSGVTRYIVRRSQSSSAPVSAADGDATCQGLFTSCADVTTLNGKLYSYSVFAVDAVGNTSVAGSSVAVTARDQLAPAAPKGLAATPGDASVDLHWSAAGADDDVAGYVLVAKQGASAPISEADGTRVCTAIVAASSACSATGLTNGATYTFGLFALDEALNRSQAAVISAAPNGKVADTKAPAAVTKLKAKVSGRTVTLTWKNPADRDFDHVVITAAERKPAARAAAKRVYSGKGTKATTKLAAGQARWFTVVAYDAAGNASPAESVRATVAAPSRFGPEPRAKVHGKVRLTWPVVKGARYYNVQVYAGKKRILVSWPVGGKLQLPHAKLKRGKTYTWYVWPGLGAKAKAHYGKLIGKSTFTFTG